MNNIRTELEVLEFIYKKYEAKYLDQVKTTDWKREAVKMSYIQIDIDKIAQEMDMDSEVLFGYLQNYLEYKYGNVQNSKGDFIHLFARIIDGKKHWVNMPRAAAVIAQLKDEERKYNAPFRVSKIAIWISIFVLGLQALQLVLDYLLRCK